MEVTTERIYQDYKEQVSGRKYWLIFLIMTPIFLIIGAAGGSIGAGILLDLAMVIYMICSTVSTNKALNKLKKGDYVVYLDVITDKKTIRSRKHKTTTWYVYSEKLFPTRKSVLPTLYNSVEVNQPFAAVYSGKKIINFYALETNPLSEEVRSKIKAK